MKNHRKPHVIGSLLALTCLAAHAQIFDSNTSGANVFKYPTTGGGGSEFIAVNGYTEGLAYSNGNLFVAQIADGAFGSDITEYNATTGIQNTTFGGTGAITGLDHPEGMTIDGTTLFVANRTNSTSATGSIGAYNTVTGLGGNLINNLYQPTAVAAYNGDLYVALNNGGGSGANGSVAEYNESTGALVTSFKLTGLSEPQGLTFDGGNLYVTNEGTGVIGEYNPVTGAAINASLITGGPVNVYQIASLPNGNLIVTSDGPGSQVSVYTAAGALVSSNFLSGSSYTTALAVAPEPSTYALVILGLGAMLLRLRRLGRA